MKILRLVLSVWVIRNYIREHATYFVLQRPLKTQEFVKLTLASIMRNLRNVEYV